MIHQEPNISVGILSAETIRFDLHGRFSVKAEGKGTCLDLLRQDIAIGAHEVGIHGKMLSFRGEAYSSLTFLPSGPEDSFSLMDVTIGKQFHWQRKEDQSFRGALKFIVEEGQVTAINILPLETYLQCVISSEMSSTSHVELLKAHAVISRSWLLAQIQDKESLQEACTREIEDGWIRWYNHSSHQNFDVCADDHCQRYQGITRLQSPKALEAIKATQGQVLMMDDEICDARYSKCCGGATELFSTCWEDRDLDYLQAFADDDPSSDLPDQTNEEEARKWIQENPKAFCNTKDKEVLSQVLNGYDQETADFYRWTETIKGSEIQGFILEKTGQDIGPVTDLIPLERGTSGRIKLLRIVGRKRELVIGKELEIRKMLSRSHLLSSAFIVEGKEGDSSDPVFTIRGAGWGHGVGLCQIGAAMMAVKGYKYQDILAHYFKGANITKLY